MDDFPLRLSLSLAPPTTPSSHPPSLLSLSLSSGDHHPFSSPSHSPTYCHFFSSEARSKDKREVKKLESQENRVDHLRSNLLQFLLLRHNHVCAPLPRLTMWIKVRALGQGSFGEVFLALPTRGNMEYVALKVSSTQNSFSLVNEKDILENFTGCPEIIQCLGSEEIMEGNALPKRIRFLGITGNSIVYALKLEYAAGGSLGDLIKRRKKLPEKEVKEFLRMILRGVSCIHSKGFVHFDLKPDNILVFPQKNGKVKLKIGDFGLSKKREPEERYWTFDPRFRGTPKYMSPESVIFGEANAPLDIWSVGCILVKMISGKPVWEGCKTRRQVMSKLVVEMETPKIPEELSETGKDFLRKCFDQNPRQRWTADMLLEHPYIRKGKNYENLPVPTQLWSLPHLNY